MLRIGLFFLVASMTFVSHAGMVSTDWKTTNDGKAVLHEETGIEWLRLKETAGSSIDNILSQTGKGQKYHGWRLATQAEASEFVESFYPDFDMTGTYNTYSKRGYDDYYWEEHERFRDAMGGTGYISASNNYGQYYRAMTFGITLDDNGDVLLSGTRHSNWGGNPRLYELNIFLGHDQSYGSDHANANAGVFLVSDGGTTLSSRLNPMLNINNPNAPINNVPISSIGGLAIIGLGGLLRRRRC